MTFKVITCILFSSIVVLGHHPEPLDLKDIGDDYYISQDNFPDIFFGLGRFGGHDVEKLTEPEDSNVGEVTNVEYKEIVQDVMELIAALKDVGVIFVEEIRIIKEIINSKKL
ncbi:hypothetical protein RR48_07616 [Papilio machaon]|uniref:Uncharacterized protein n=1 Tax=Papilio machaon TaxID=76193 RepID=A0A194QQF9_PAPMA|nr:hypothetical protein RR48_07616 [Papilio machaon]